ncbi:MAG: ribosomal protein S18-alanine N-acetyltransferase [Candidatus Nealsonbacteria bacterium]|nr:ribosomal protein S18-alanine N-acetyltransferase [Candidatus Nealsonbacteria bacterium]
MIKLKQFQLSDLSEVLRISKSSFSHPWSRAEFQKCYKDYPKEFIVAEDHGKIAGFIVGKISNNVGVIKLIAVDIRYRSKGIGKDLLGFLLDYFQQQGLKKILARTRIQNKTGADFLENFGLEMKKTIKNYYSNGEDAYLMEKTLGG